MSLIRLKTIRVKRFSLSFRDYEFKAPKLSVEEARYNMSTYEAPLHVTVELSNKVTGEKKEQDICFGVIILG